MPKVQRMVLLTEVFMFQNQTSEELVAVPVARISKIVMEDLSAIRNPAKARLMLVSPVEVMHVKESLAEVVAIVNAGVEP